MSLVSIHCVVSGKVQGVSYRWFVYTQAKKLNVTGWVKNCDDGSVEAIISGPDEQVNHLLTYLATGPEMAIVEQVSKKNIPYESFSGFEIK